MSCALCSGRGQPCVTSSWESLDRAAEALTSKIEADKKVRDNLFEQLALLQARISRNEKVLAENNRKVEKKMDCLASEASEDPQASTEDMLALEGNLQLAGVPSPFSWADSGSGDLLSPKTLDQMVANLANESGGPAS